MMFRGGLAINRTIVSRQFIRWKNTTAYNEVVDTIRNDLKINFRAKADVMEKNVIRAILTEIKNLEIKNNNKQDNDEFQLYELFSTMIKQRQESAKEYMANGNPDRFHQLGQNELRECDYISKYLTGLNMISEGELEDKLKKIIEEVEADGEKATMATVYKKIPMKSVEKDWNCSKVQIRQLLVKLLNLNF